MPLTSRELVKYRKQLEDRRTELKARLRSTDAELSQPRDRDFEDQATEREFDEVLEAEGRMDLREIGAIDAALTRIENGSYGVCARCANEISRERLASLPHTPMCRVCA